MRKVIAVIVFGVLTLLDSAVLYAQAGPAKTASAVHAGGFADALFVHRSGRSGFGGGDLDLFLTARLSDRWSFFAETFARRPGPLDEAGSRDTRIDADIERFYIAYNPTDTLRVELGQTHTGIVRWNEREHRSLFLQTTIDVPSLATRAEEGGAWPLHFLGVWTSGRIPGSLGVQYGLGGGKGRGAARDDSEPLLDPGALSALASLSIAPDRWLGLEAGAAAYGGNIPAPAGRMRELDTTLFAAFLRSGIEVRSEWGRMRHQRTSGGPEFFTRSWYALASWRPRGHLDFMRPYVLIDHLKIATGETYLADVHDQDAWAAGVRWDLSPHVAIKTDYRSELDALHKRQGLLRLQLTAAF